MAPDLRIALVGCGSHGAARLAPAIRAAPGAVLSACVDPDADAARAAAHGQADVLPDLDALTHAPRVDAAVIAVPHDLLAPTALACLRAGLHVLVEKPVGVTEAEGAAVAAAARAAGLTCMAAYCQRFLEVRTRARDLLRRGLAGDVRTAAASKGGPPLTGWLADPARGGGQLLFLGSHLVDQLLWLHRQPVTRVYAAMTHRDDTGSDESTSGVIEFADGVSAAISLSQAAGAPYDHLEIIGTGGRIRSDWLSGQIDVETAAGHAARRPRVEYVRSDPMQPMYDAEVAEFAAAVHAGRPPAVDGDDAVRVLRVLDALRASAARGAPVDIADGAARRSAAYTLDAADAHLRIQFTYPSDRIQEPFLYDLSQRFHLKFNIRRADVDAGIGWMQVLLEGERSEIDAAIAWAEAQGIRADPVEGDVISG